MKKIYCVNCGIETENIIIKKEIEETINNVKTCYVEEYNKCKICGEEFYTEETLNKNIETYGNIVRKINNIITIDEIKDIMMKYNIGKKPLSLAMGFSEITIIRYLEGQIPERIYSDLLKEVLNNPYEMLKYLMLNQDRISPIAYKKAIEKIKEILNSPTNSNIYEIINTILSKSSYDITPLALQKILYFIQGFSKSILNYQLFNDNCEAWRHGPVYRHVYNRFSEYKYNEISKELRLFGDNKRLLKNEKEYVINILNIFGKYSGKVLEKMSHYTIPWEKNRIELCDDESSSNLISLSDIENYFDSLNLTNANDINKYAQKLYEKINFEGNLY